MTFLTLKELKKQGFINLPYLAFDIGGVKYETYSHGVMRAEVIGSKINRLYEMLK